MLVKNVTHYFKWAITEDLSIRYFVTFGTKKELEGKWCIKSHRRKEYSVLSGKIAQDLVLALPDPKRVEIIGRVIDGKYSKVIVIADVVQMISEDVSND